MSSLPESKNESGSSTEASTPTSISSLTSLNCYTLAPTLNLGYYPATYAMPTTTINSLETIDPSAIHSLDEAQLIGEHNKNYGLVAPWNDWPSVPLTDEPYSLASASLPREGDLFYGVSPAESWGFCTSSFAGAFDPIFGGPDAFGPAESWGLYSSPSAETFDPISGEPCAFEPADSTLTSPVGGHQRLGSAIDKFFDTSELMGFSNTQPRNDGHFSMPMASADIFTTTTGAQNQVLSNSFSFPQQSDLNPVTVSSDDAYQHSPQTPSSSSEHTRTPSKPHKVRWTPASLVSNKNHKAQDFVNYTNENVWRETKLVSPSGSSKTRQRREKKVKERWTREKKDQKLSTAVECCIGRATDTLAELERWERARDEQKQALSSVVECNIKKTADALAELKRNLEEQLAGTDNVTL